VLGNPHSTHGWGLPRADDDALRRLTLAACHADGRDYVCVLTSGATAALKLVGEAFPWCDSLERGKEQWQRVPDNNDAGFSSSSDSPLPHPGSQQSHFLYMEDNHNSVLGIRELAAYGGARCASVRASTWASGAGAGTGARALFAKGTTFNLEVCGEGGEFLEMSGEEDPGRPPLSVSSLASSLGECNEQGPCHLFAYPWSRTSPEPSTLLG
jgi:hypothetical protein